MKRSQLAMHSISTGGATLEERLAAYKEAGFDKVEFYLGHIHSYLGTGKTVADARGLLAKNGLTCIGGFYNQTVSAFSPEAEREANNRLVIENARLVGELGGTSLVVGTDGPAQPVDDPIGALAEAFAGIASRVPPDVNVCIEFNWSPIVKSLPFAAEIALRSAAPNVGVLFDPAHYHCTPTKLEHLTPRNVALIKHVHVNDMRNKPGELCDCNADRVLPGEGILDLKTIFGRIEEYGYRGLFSIEMFDAALAALPPDVAAKRMFASLLPLCEPHS